MSDEPGSDTLVSVVVQEVNKVVAEAEEVEKDESLTVLLNESAAAAAGDDSDASVRGLVSSASKGLRDRTAVYHQRTKEDIQNLARCAGGVLLPDWALIDSSRETSCRLPPLTFIVNKLSFYCQFPERTGSTVATSPVPKNIENVDAADGNVAPRVFKSRRFFIC